MNIDNKIEQNNATNEESNLTQAHLTKEELEYFKQLLLEES